MPQIKFSYHHKVLTLGHKVPNVYHKFSFHNILKDFLFHSDCESHKSSFLSLQSTFRWASHFDFKVFILTKFFSYLIIPTAWLTKYTMVAIRIEGTKNKLGMTKKHCFFFHWKHLLNFPAKIGRQRPLVRGKALY